MRPRHLSIFLLILVGSLFTSTILYAQDFSNKGKDFWVAYTGHIDGLTSRMALYLTSEYNTSGTVEVNGNVIPFTITAYNVTTVQLTKTTTPSNAVAYNDQSEGIVGNKGIHIISLNPIVAYAHILNAARSGSTLVLPTNVLGREYIVASYKTVGSTNQHYAEFAVIATEDNTTIEVTPTDKDLNSTKQAGVPFQVLMQKGEVYQYQSTGDLTGTAIKSVATSTSPCKKIAVYSGSTWTALGCTTASSGDNLYQQLFPSSAWGKTYYTSPAINKSFDLFRIIVQDPNELVYVNGVALDKNTIVNGRFYEISTAGNNTYRIITAAKPISVLQYFITQNCDNITGDPEMITLNPIEQTLSDITIMSAKSDLTPPNTNITAHYLNIIFKTSALSSLKIDGLSPNAIPVTMGTSGYSYIQENVTASTNTNPSHRVVSDSGFICIAYGFGNVESYGYNAGANVRDLYQTLTVNNPLGVVKLPASCKGTPFKVNMTLPYIPTLIKWIIPTYTDTPTTYNPVPIDSSIVNGKSIYTFTLNNSIVFDSVGTFNVQVIVNNPTSDGCSGEQQIDFDLIIYGPPSVGNLITSTNCISDSILMKDQTLIAKDDRKIISYNWDIGDGIFHNAQNYAILPNWAGKYTIKYFVITDIGCLSDTITKEVLIDSVPKVNFIIPSITCISKDIIFKDATLSTGTATLDKWIWNFGDSSQVDTLLNNGNLTHVFDSLKNYTVKLSVTTLNGCLSSKQQTFSNNPNPVVGFILPEICLEDAFAQFTDTTKIAGSANAFSYKWNFGDLGNTMYPNTDIVANPKHRYQAPGDYKVILQVTSVTGCVGIDTSDFTVNGSIPKAGFKVVNESALCSNKEVEFVNNSKVDIGSVGKLIVFWDFDGDLNDTTIDENPTIGKSYKHLYKNFQFPNKMNFTIKLMAYSGGSCADDSITSVAIVPPPQTASTITSKDYVCLFDTLNVNAKVVGGVAPFVYTWSTSNGNASFTGNTLHGITAGTVDISLKMVDPKQCVYAFDTIKNIVIRAIPTAILLAGDTVICNGDKVTLKGAGSSYFKWLLNNVQFYESSVDTIATDLKGYYKLIVNDGKCNSLASDSILLKPLDIPIYSIHYNPIICTNTPLDIQTDATDKSFIHFVWDFGDSSSYAKANPNNHSYKKSGTYLVKLNITNDYCKKYEYQLIGDSIKVIDPVSPSNFTLFILADVDSLLSPFKKDSGYSVYRWDPMTYLSDALIPTPHFRSNKSIEYILNRIDPVTACKVEDIYKVEVSPDVIVSIPKAFTPNGDNLNDLLKIEYGAGLKMFNGIKIFNRFGKIVYLSTNLSDGWDGKLNGIDQEMDAYTYLIDYITYKDEHITKTGSVILIR